MILTEENFLTFAARGYINEYCETDQEFEEDVSRIKFIRKLFTIYDKTGELNVNLLLNHLVVLYNVFEHKTCTKMLFFKLPEYWPHIKASLYHSGYLPREIRGIYKEDFIVELSTIPMKADLYNKIKGFTRC